MATDAVVGVLSAAWDYVPAGKDVADAGSKVLQVTKDTVTDVGSKALKVSTDAAKYAASTHVGQATIGASYEAARYVADSRVGTAAATAYEYVPSGEDVKGYASIAVGKVIEYIPGGLVEARRAQVEALQSGDEADNASQVRTEDEWELVDDVKTPKAKPKKMGTLERERTDDTLDNFVKWKLVFLDSKTVPDGTPIDDGDSASDDELDRVNPASATRGSVKAVTEMKGEAVVAKRMSATERQHAINGEARKIINEEKWADHIIIIDETDERSVEKILRHLKEGEDTHVIAFGQSNIMRSQMNTEMLMASASRERAKGNAVKYDIDKSTSIDGACEGTVTYETNLKMTALWGSMDHKRLMQPLLDAQGDDIKITLL